MLVEAVVQSPFATLRAVARRQRDSAERKAALDVAQNTAANSAQRDAVLQKLVDLAKREACLTRRAG